MYYKVGDGRPIHFSRTSSCAFQCVCIIADSRGVLVAIIGARPNPSFLAWTDNHENILAIGNLTQLRSNKR